MDSLLIEIYSTIIPSAPYLIAAYVLILVILFVFVAIVFRRIKKAEQHLSLIEETLQEIEE